MNFTYIITETCSLTVQLYHNIMQVKEHL